MVLCVPSSISEWTAPRSGSENCEVEELFTYDIRNLRLYGRARW
jgi:hypothetical protein